MATYNFIESSGLIIADTSQTLEEVNSEYREIFGEDFTTDPETPEGVLISAEVTSRDSVARNNANVANQINPNIAGGPFLDAILALTGDERSKAERSTVVVNITGVANTPIEAGSIAQTALGAQFRSTVFMEIPLSGSITSTFESVLTGPIPAGSNMLTQIVDSVIGWETITNPSPAVLGRGVESGGASRARRRNTLALQGRSTALAITSELYNISGVRSLAFLENIAGVTVVINGITLVGHSIWAAVLGGLDADIGSALLEAKSSGSDWNGAQTVDVLEPASGQVFAVRFDRPTPVSILIRYTIRANPNQPTEPAATVRAATLAYANGEIDGEEGFVVGGSVSPYELAGAVNRASPEIFILNVEIALNDGSPVFSTDTLDIALDAVATIEEESIQVLIV